MPVAQGRAGLPTNLRRPFVVAFDRSPEGHYGAETGDNGCVEHTASLIARWLSAGDEGDVDAFDDLLHSDVVVHAPRGLSTKNLESEKQIWRDAVAAMPDLHHDVQEVVTQGSVQAARVIVTGTLRQPFAGVPGTGRSFCKDQAVICPVRDGKICEAWEIADVGSLVDQVGS
jgi:steroid delta-isomerase-like uncharacterized protein